MDNPKFLTSEDLARRFRLSPRTITRLAREGRLPAPVRISAGTLRWQADVIDQWQKHKTRIEGVNS